MNSLKERKFVRCHNPGFYSVNKEDWEAAHNNPLENGGIYEVLEETNLSYSLKEGLYLKQRFEELSQFEAFALGLFIDGS